jgi:hypothetical protein
MKIDRTILNRQDSFQYPLEGYAKAAKRIKIEFELNRQDAENGGEIPEWTDRNAGIQHIGRIRPGSSLCLSLRLCGSILIWGVPGGLGVVAVRFYGRILALKHT